MQSVEENNVLWKNFTILGTTNIFLGALVVAVKLHTEVTTLRKDVGKLEEDCKTANEKIQNNFVSSVRTESAVKSRKRR